MFAGEERVWEGNRDLSIETNRESWNLVSSNGARKDSGFSKRFAGFSSVFVNVREF